MIQTILMTDPTKHFQHHKKLDNLLQNEESIYQEENLDNFMIFAGNMVHCADLHGPAKPSSEA